MFLFLLKTGWQSFCFLNETSKQTNKQTNKREHKASAVMCYCYFSLTAVVLPHYEDAQGEKEKNEKLTNNKKLN